MKLWVTGAPDEPRSFPRGPSALNIVIDIEIIVTIGCYIKLGSNIFLPNVCGGRSLISKGGGFRQIV